MPRKAIQDKSLLAKRKATEASKKMLKMKATVKRPLSKTEKAWLAARKKRSELLKKIHLAELKNLDDATATNQAVALGVPRELVQAKPTTIHKLAALGIKWHRQQGRKKKSK
jgi:hypothetical protein